MINARGGLPINTRSYLTRYSSNRIVCHPEALEILPQISNSVNAILKLKILAHIKFMWILYLNVYSNLFMCNHLSNRFLLQKKMKLYFKDNIIEMVSLFFFIGGSINDVRRLIILINSWENILKDICARIEYLICE